jgi:hypothetical protein
MSAELEQARQVAERIAKRLSTNPELRPAAQGTESVSAELASVRAGLSELQHRLAAIESKFSPQAGAPGGSVQPPLTRSPWLAGVNAIAHPSQERFGIEEATVSELVDFFEKEKMCSVEPGEKPCDHCAMCSSRGF